MSAEQRGEFARAHSGAPAVRRRVLAPVLWGFVLAALVAIAGWPRTWPQLPDVDQYRTLALAGPAQVRDPFAGRIIPPLASRAVAAATGMNIDAAFLAVNVAALVLFAIALAKVLDDVAGAPALAVALGFTPLIVNEFWMTYYGDLFHASLAAWFFLAMMRRWLALALGLLVALLLTRESTLLLVAALIALALARGDRRLLAATVGASAAGLAIVAVLNGRALANAHAVNGVVFLMLKVPFEFARNLLGLDLLPNTLIAAGKPCTPLLVVGLPRWLRAGALSSVSFCGFRAQWAAYCWTMLAAVFGVCPGAMASVLVMRGRRALASAPLWLAIAVVYGALAYAFGPGQGVWLEREIGYGWPLFWIALPALAAPLVRDSPCAVAALLALNLAAAWLPEATGRIAGDAPGFYFAALAAAVALNYGAYRLLARSADALAVAAAAS
jgi:hypothetical protein